MQNQANATVSASINMPILELNSSGEAVLYAKKLLYSYSFTKIEPTNDIFDADTEAAVTALQQHYQYDRDNGFAVEINGTIDRETWRALGDHFYRRCRR
jgi:peptidoglycan hydrolase-like protein with peptidoglycan-binding domain